jgi:xylulokinase
MTTLVAGVDSSTQSCKVVFRDARSGRVVAAGRATHPAGTEVDPEAWWDALQAALAEAGGLGSVSCLSIAAQQHGMVALDQEGRVIRPALLWNDTRSAGAAAALVREVGADEYVQRTGLIPVASFTASKLRWLRDAEPANAAKVAAVALPHDWLTWRLRGYGPAASSPLGPVLEELTTDRSDASGTGYWDPEANRYDMDLFTLALGHVAIVPNVLRPHEPAGKTPGGVMLGAGAGDNAAAALGLNASGQEAIVSIGTSGTVFAPSAELHRDRTGSVAGFADAAGAFLPIATTLNAARILTSVAEVLGVDNDEFSRLALEAPPGAGGAVLIPWFEGERTPNLPNATGSLHGLSLTAMTRPNLARAAVEGMLCGLAGGLDALRRAGALPERVLLIGGGAQNRAVRSIAAQVFDMPVSVPVPGEYVAEGATVQAAWVLDGVRPDWPPHFDAELRPDPRPSIRDQYRSHAEPQETWFRRHSEGAA